jgi:hypothetical protein
MTTFYYLRFKTPSTWRTRSPYLYPPGTGWPGYTPGIGYPFRRLLRFAGIRWRYWTPPPYKLWIPLSSQNYIATDDQSLSDQIFITVPQLRSCLCGVPSLKRGRIYILYMLVALASAVFLGSESLTAPDHILLSQILSFFLCRFLRLARSSGMLVLVI